MSAMSEIEHLTANVINAAGAEDSQDRRTVLAVVLGLVLLASLALAGAIYLAAVKTPVPDLLGYVVTGGLGALSAMLATTRTRQS